MNHALLCEEGIISSEQAWTLSSKYIAHFS
jgi:hypothetical protein